MTIVLCFMTIVHNLHTVINLTVNMRTCNMKLMRLRLIGFKCNLLCNFVKRMIVADYSCVTYSIKVNLYYPCLLLLLLSGVAIGFKCFLNCNFVKSMIVVDYSCVTYSIIYFVLPWFI